MTATSWPEGDARFYFCLASEPRSSCAVVRQTAPVPTCQSTPPGRFAQHLACQTHTPTDSHADARVPLCLAGHNMLVHPSSVFTDFRLATDGPPPLCAMSIRDMQRTRAPGVRATND